LVAFVSICSTISTIARHTRTYHHGVQVKPDEKKQFFKSPSNFGNRAAFVYVTLMIFLIQRFLARSKREGEKKGVPSKDNADRIDTKV
jgi:abortive infection bacteriophage resistance protein